jgi:DNA-binding NarL/FixJ family response regulator
MARFVVEMVFETEDARLRAVRPAHRRYWADLAVRGVLLRGGFHADESVGRMLCEASDGIALRRLVDGDPCVRGKLVRSVQIREPRITRSAVVTGSALTAHENRIAALILGGKTNREIAAQFRVTVRAIELHITSIYRKLGINRRAQLAGALAA